MPVKHPWAYHRPRGEPCDCGLPTAWHRDEARRRFWVGLDGEGIGRRPHRYVLLAYSDESSKHSDYIYAKKGLSSKDCFDFILSVPTDAVPCGYYLGYDWTMMLRDLPNRAIYRLLRPELRALPHSEGGQFSPVVWNGFRLNYLAGAMTLRKKDRRVTVWDLGRFFQGPFIDAIEAWTCGDAKQRALVKRMKEKRSGFEQERASSVRQYCFLECTLLAELAGKLEDAHAQVELRPRSWHGPGSTAGAALKIMGISAKRGEQSPLVQALARHAYFGGRFEQSVQGLIPGPVFSFDIASAYPFQAYRLPCLEHGAWHRVTSEKRMREARHALVRYELEDIGEKEVWGPLPHRTAKGAILFPRGGVKGWVWRDEYQVARENWTGVRFREAWCLDSDCDCRPFAKVLDWYRERVALGKDGRGRVLKLALNSVYGKLAQQTGKPQYGSMVWAGMVTSGTRAQLLDLLVAHPKGHQDVLALATDGLYTQAKPRVPAPPLAPETLGAWEEKQHGDMLFVRPGIYWGDDVVRARGVGRRVFKAHYRTAQRAIERGLSDAELGKVDVFHGAMSSVYRTQAGVFRRSPRYGQWCERPVRVGLSPAPKRAENYRLWMLDGQESAPYRHGSVPREIAQTLRTSWGLPR